MDEKLKQQWIKALRSGVLCDLIGPDGWDADCTHRLEGNYGSFLSQEALARVGFDKSTQFELGNMNDEMSKTQASAPSLEDGKR